MSTRTLAGKEVYQMSVDPTKLMTKPKAGSGAVPRPYYRAKFDGIGFTIDNQKFIDALLAGEVTEVYLAEGERLIDDPMVAGAKKAIKSLTFSNFLSTVQEVSITEHQAKIDKIKNPVLNEVDVNDELLAKMQHLIAAKASV